MTVGYEIIKHLKYDCENWNNIWRSSIYGEPCEDDRKNIDIDSDVILTEDAPDIDITTKFLESNFCACAMTPRCVRVFCKKCEANFKKVKYFQDRNELQLLAENWNLEYDPLVKLNTVKTIQTHEKFLEGNNLTIDPNWKTYEFDSYFDEELTPHLYTLFDYDIVNLGWYFNKSIEPLLRLPNLKGIILGYWFGKDLNPLKDLKGLKFIQVRASYNMPLDEKVYNLTYC